MAATTVAGETQENERYVKAMGQLAEIGRQLHQQKGYPFRLEDLNQHLQAAIEGRFNRPAVVIRQKSTHVTTLSEKNALDIMGKNGHGIADVENYFGVDFTPEQKEKLALVPFSEATLHECAATHILFPGFPLGLLEIRAKAPRQPKTFYSYDDAWYNNQRFAKEQQVAVQWYLVRKDVVPKSTSKNYEEQTQLLQKEYGTEWIPTAADFAYGVVLHYLAFGERLLGAIYARTSSVGSGGDRVDLGYFDAKGLDVYNDWDDSRYAVLGLASARKFD